VAVLTPRAAPVTDRPQAYTRSASTPRRGSPPAAGTATVERARHKYLPRMDQPGR